MLHLCRLINFVEDHLFEPYAIRSVAESSELFSNLPEVCFDRVALVAILCNEKVKGPISSDTRPGAKTESMAVRQLTYPLLIFRLS